MLFSAFFVSGLAYTSIKVYFSAIGNWHLSWNQHTSYQDALTPHLEQVLRGIKKEQATTHPERIRLCSQNYDTDIVCPIKFFN